ncbi:MAG: exonuclease SbcCD subunit D [Muribaculaceae bacterium]|nr:exonuclease SbcCD subunit D [Muribaculaceae bacterium]
MRILHTADLHLGQILYQYYDRVDEHVYFFNQLEKWVEEFRPDALIVSGDIFDVAQPSAATWKMFTRAFVSIRQKAPEMHIVIIAGNHDSASRLQAHSEVWALASTTIIGTPPPPAIDISKDPDRFIVRLPAGFIISLPYMASSRNDLYLKLQEYVDKINSNNLPVVMTGHMTATGADMQGHKFDIGNLHNIDPDSLGDKFDYLALGHIHRPQTIGHSADIFKDEVEYEAPVVRYSGSPLHVSCDETYPHSVSLVEINERGGAVRIRQLKIDQLRHFKNLPESEKTFDTEKDAINEIKKFIKNGSDHCYLRLRFKDSTVLASDFNNKVYSLLESSGKDLRYNPKHIRVTEKAEIIPGIENGNDIRLETITQMENPLDFIRMNTSKFPDLSIEEIEKAFEEIETELKSLREES